MSSPQRCFSTNGGLTWGTSLKGELAGCNATPGPWDVLIADCAPVSFDELRQFSEDLMSMETEAILELLDERVHDGYWDDVILPEGKSFFLTPVDQHELQPLLSEALAMGLKALTPELPWRPEDPKEAQVWNLAIHRDDDFLPVDEKIEGWYVTYKDRNLALEIWRSRGLPAGTPSPFSEEALR